MSVHRKSNKTTAVRCITTGEVFSSISEASLAKDLSYSSIWMCCKGQQSSAKGLSWEYIGPVGKWGGPGRRWMPEEDAIIREHSRENARAFQHLLPTRSLESITQRKRALIKDLAVKEYEDQENRPLTDETAYQCRIEYADKLARGYTPEEAIRWVAEANERTVEIVRDAIFNPAHDAQVEACKRKYTDPKDGIAEGYDLAEILAELDSRFAEIKTNGQTPVIGTNLRTGKMLGFMSISATRTAGFNPTNVTECVKGKKKSHHGFKWEKASELMIGQKLKSDLLTPKKEKKAPKEGAKTTKTGF